ncbi:S41 family peptidase [Flavihumibacter sp. UBA7668]|uniref:S41 family peptidase n=1 Tax=Flavihumibacter sp. UBA7668 TaxID=1946542 RepID=UPI0025BDCF45|nr:S41 family peptidase [Flavihumibacter sp. UBA7668]
MKYKFIKILLVVVISVVGFFSYGQSSDCDCRANLDTLIVKTEENYAGYPAKVNPGTERNYQKLITDLRSKALAEVNPKKCYYLLSSYVRFFKDKHFIVAFMANKDIDSVVVPVKEENVKSYLNKKKRDRLEGIWLSADSSSRIAIIKNKAGEYQGIRLASSTDQFPVGFVYFTIRQNGEKIHVKTYDRFMSTDVPVKLYGNLLQFWNGAIYGRVFPENQHTKEREELTQWRQNNGLFYSELAPDVAYLKIASFGNNEQQIAELVQANDKSIRQHPFLIIDLRGNSGGSTGWVSLLPYLMTNPIDQPSSYVHTSPDNVKMKLSELAIFATNPIPAEYSKYFPEEIVAQYKKAYQELPTTKLSFYPLPSVRFPLDSVLVQPRKVALVVDDRCGSSAEYFFYLAKQSKKTISYGSNTVGMMDYEGMSIPTKMPFDRFIVTIPGVKSNWTDNAPIDQTGFQPDIVLKQPYEDWISIIIADLRK